MDELIKPYNYSWLIPLCVLGFVVIFCTCFLLRKEIYNFLKNTFFPNPNRYSIPSAILSRVTGTMPEPSNKEAEEKVKVMHESIAEDEPPSPIIPPEHLAVDIPAEEPQAAPQPQVEPEHKAEPELQPVPEQKAEPQEPAKPEQQIIPEEKASPEQQAAPEQKTGQENNPQAQQEQPKEQEKEITLDENPQQEPKEKTAMREDSPIKLSMERQYSELQNKFKAINWKRDVITERNLVIFALIVLFSMNLCLCISVSRLKAANAKQQAQILKIQQIMVLENELKKIKDGAHANRPVVVYKLPAKGR